MARRMLVTTALGCIAAMVLVGAASATTYRPGPARSTSDGRRCGTVDIAILERQVRVRAHGVSSCANARAVIRIAFTSAARGGPGRTPGEAWYGRGWPCRFVNSPHNRCWSVVARVARSTARSSPEVAGTSDDPEPRRERVPSSQSERDSWLQRIASTSEPRR
jgi:hypothetical protein